MAYGRVRWLTDGWVAHRPGSGLLAGEWPTVGPVAYGRGEALRPGKATEGPPYRPPADRQADLGQLGRRLHGGADERRARGRFDASGLARRLAGARDSPCGAITTARDSRNPARLRRLREPLRAGSAGTIRPGPRPACGWRLGTDCRRLAASG